MSKTQTERPTPITDAAVTDVIGRADRLNADEWQQRFGKLANHMRNIEHQLDDSLEQRDRLVWALKLVMGSWIGGYSHHAHQGSYDAANNAIAAVKGGEA